MSSVSPTAITRAVEGLLDESVAMALVAHVGAQAGPAYGFKGKLHLRDRIQGYNLAAAHAPWLVLVDLDTDHLCPPPMVADWVRNPAPMLCFRVVVHECEAWLLSDRKAFAAFMGVGVAHIPLNPEAVLEPKELVVSLARRSRRRDIRGDLVPSPGSGRSVGPAYGARLSQFVRDNWHPARAAESSESLRRAIDCLKQLAALGFRKQSVGSP